jgi:hypothetical protein
MANLAITFVTMSVKGQCQHRAIHVPTVPWSLLVQYGPNAMVRLLECFEDEYNWTEVSSELSVAQRLLTFTIHPTRLN